MSDKKEENNSAVTELPSAGISITRTAANGTELEKYYYQLQSQNKDLLEIGKIYISSNNGILKDSSLDLFNSVLR